MLQLYDHIIKYHHEKLRMSGYHEFYRATLIHKGIPLHIVSLWNCVILGIQTIMQHQYGADFFDHCTKSLFSPTAYIVIFCAVETALLVGVHGTYIQRVIRFNRATLPPDVFRGLSPTLNSVILFVEMSIERTQRDDTTIFQYFVHYRNRLEWPCEIQRRQTYSKNKQIW